MIVGVQYPQPSYTQYHLFVILFSKWVTVESMLSPHLTDCRVYLILSRRWVIFDSLISRPPHTVCCGIPSRWWVIKLSCSSCLSDCVVLVVTSTRPWVIVQLELYFHTSHMPYCACRIPCRTWVIVDSGFHTLLTRSIILVTYSPGGQSSSIPSFHSQLMECVFVAPHVDCASLSILSLSETLS